MLQHAPIWMSWQSPYQLQTMLNDRGLVTVDLVPPTAEIGQVHVRGTVEASSDPVGAQRELGGAVSAAFGPALGLVVLPSEVVAVLVPRTKLEDVDPSVPLLLHKTDVNLIRTDARGMQVLVNPALTLVLHVGAARVHIYRMNEEAVTVMHQRVPLELLVRALLARPRRRYAAGGERAVVCVHVQAQFSVEADMRMWQFSRFNESGFSCLSQPEPDKPATLMEYVLKDELVDARPRLVLGVSARVNSYDWSDDNLRLAIGCEDGTVCIHTRGTKDAGGGAGLQRVEVEGRQPVRARAPPVYSLASDLHLMCGADVRVGWGCRWCW